MFLEIFDELSCQKKRTLKLRALALENQSSKGYTTELKSFEPVDDSFFSSLLIEHLLRGTSL